MLKKNRIMTAFFLSLIVSFTLVHSAGAAASKNNFLDVSKQHWGYEAIQWAAANGIVNGDGKGKFLPNTEVNEKEFLAMLLRAYQNDFEVAKPTKNEQWYEPYYQMAKILDWSAYGIEGYYNRGFVADLLASAVGKFLSDEDCIQFLLDEGLAKGKTSNTVAGYKADDPLTRAEAVTFIYRFKQAIPSLVRYQDNGLQLFGIQLGDAEQAVREKLGAPARQDGSEDGFTWYIYNEKYADFAQIGIQNNKVVALYSNAAGAWSSNQTIISGMTKKQVTGVIKEDVEPYLLTNYRGSVVKTFYFDAINGNKLDAIFIKIRTYNENESISGDALWKNYERQIFDLTNAFRYKYGSTMLGWDDTAAHTAREHSKDMKVRNYFAHTNLDGLSPFDRMQADGISYSAAGENIARGHDDSFHAYNGWINSSGHRANMLSDHYTLLGVGVYESYYTQNFYTPR